MGNNRLQEIFGKSEEDLETFVDTLISSTVVDPEMEPMLESAKDNIATPVDAPRFVEQFSGYVRIQYGYSSEDYVWHIAAFHPKKVINFRVSIDRVIYAIATVMKAHLPSDAQAKIWRPNADWDIQEITFKALDMNDVWQFNDKLVETINKELFETLNTLF